MTDFSTLSDDELALDLTAEVFAAALAASGRYRPGEAAARTWLFGIARNKLAEVRPPPGAGRLGQAQARHRDAELRRRGHRGRSSPSEPGGRDEPRPHTPGCRRPVGAIRTELIDAARRRRGARRRRRGARRRHRRLLTLAAATAGLLAAASGAIALTNTATGVPAIDRLLDSAARHTPQPGGDPPPGVEPPPIPDVRPLAGSVSPPFEVPLGDGRRAVAVGYQSSDRMICAALAEPDVVADPPRGGVGCLSPKLLTDSLAVDGARVAGASGPANAEGTAAEAIMVHGFAREDVHGVTLLDPEGPVEAALSEAWTPGEPIDRPIRVFFGVVGTTDIRDVIGHRLELRFADGTAREVGP